MEIALDGGRGIREERARVQLRVTGMTCTACSRRVEKALSGTAGVLSANVNVATEKAVVEYGPASASIEKLAGVVEGVGYGIVSLRLRTSVPEPLGFFRFALLTVP